MLGADCPQEPLLFQQCRASRTGAYPPAPKKRCFTLSSRRTGYTPQFSTSFVTIAGLPCSATLHTGAAFLQSLEQPGLSPSTAAGTFALQHAANPHLTGLNSDTIASSISAAVMRPSSTNTCKAAQQGVVALHNPAGQQCRLAMHGLALLSSRRTAGCSSLRPGQSICNGHACQLLSSTALSTCNCSQRTHLHFLASDVPLLLTPDQLVFFNNSHPHLHAGRRAQCRGSSWLGQGWGWRRNTTQLICCRSRADNQPAAPKPYPSNTCQHGKTHPPERQRGGLENAEGAAQNDDIIILHSCLVPLCLQGPQRCDLPDDLLGRHARCVRRLTELVPGCISLLQAAVGPATRHGLRAGWKSAQVCSWSWSPY